MDDELWAPHMEILNFPCEGLWAQIFKLKPPNYFCNGGSYRSITYEGKNGKR